MRRYIIPVTTAADGSATVYSPGISGKIHSIHYLKTNFADGVGVTVTAEATGESIWAEAAVNAAAVRYPRAPVCSQAGVASLYAAGGTAVQDRIGLGADRVKIVIAAGGNATTGAFHVVVDR